MKNLKPEVDRAAIERLRKKQIYLWPTKGTSKTITRKTRTYLS